MEVNFGPALEAKIAHFAARLGRNPDELVQDVLTRYFEEEARFVEAVKRGEESFERDGYLTREQVGERLQRFLQPDGSPLVVARGGRPGAHLRTNRARRPPRRTDRL